MGSFLFLFSNLSVSFRQPLFSRTKVLNIWVRTNICQKGPGLNLYGHNFTWLHWRSPQTPFVAMVQRIGQQGLEAKSTSLNPNFGWNFLNWLMRRKIYSKTIEGEGSLMKFLIPWSKKPRRKVLIHSPLLSINFVGTGNFFKNRRVPLWNVLVTSAKKYDTEWWYCRETPRPPMLEKFR